MATAEETKSAAMKNEIARLTRYVDGLKQRLAGALDKNLRFVIEIDLKKTQKRIEKLV
jgi:hypothetical protein